MSAESSSGEEVVAALNSLGLFGAGRLVIVEAAERWKKPDAEAIRAYLAAPAPGAVVDGEAVLHDSRRD